MGGRLLLSIIDDQVLDYVRANDSDYFRVVLGSVSARDNPVHAIPNQEGIW